MRAHRARPRRGPPRRASSTTTPRASSTPAGPPATSRSAGRGRRTRRPPTAAGAASSCGARATTPPLYGTASFRRGATGGAAAGPGGRMSGGRARAVASVCPCRPAGWKRSATASSPSSSPSWCWSCRCRTAPTWRRCARLAARAAQLRAELRLPRHLLEQPPPHAPGRPSGSTGAILWANLHLLFWLSLVPFATGVDGREPVRRRPRRRSTASCCSRPAIAYYAAADGDHPRRRGRTRCSRARSAATSRARSRRCCTPPGIGLAFVNQWLSMAIYVAVALIWLVPDRRIERTMRTSPPPT